jgi:hypothetical protein
MPTPHIEELADRFEVKADAPRHVAWLRDRLQLHHLSVLRGSARWTTSHPELARYVALALISAGTIGLCVSLFEYQWLLRYLWRPDFRPVAGVSRDRWNTPVCSTRSRST